MQKIYLKPHKDESLRRFHPWIFSGAIHHMSAQPDDGAPVEVYTAEGEYIATGHFQNATIMVRVLTFSHEPIDQAFYERRIATCLDVRRSIGLVQTPPQAATQLTGLPAEPLSGNPSDSKLTNAYRLVHGEGDNLPGLVVDIYGRTAVMQAHSVGMHRDRHIIAAALKATLADNLDNIYYKSETTLPNKTELQQENCFLMGGSADDIAVENGLRFHVDWLHGQKTGFFVDQRENRRLLEQYAHGRNVLNMFCYTGGFSFYAMRGQARLVHSVDSSQKAIDLTNANVRLNFPDDPRHEAFAEDAFRFLDRMTATNSQPSGSNPSEAKSIYDLIILDPPAFAKHKDALRNALKGYTRLNRRALEKIQPGGILFTFSCSQAVNKDQFRAAVFTAAAAAGRNVRILHQLHQPADHPVSIYHPEGEYLKGLVLYVE